MIMRGTAVTLAVVAMLSWGLWVVFADLAGETLSGELTVVITYFVGGLIGAGYLLTRGTMPSVSSTAVAYGVLSGIFFGIGGIAYYTALQRGTAAVATTIAAMYFVVASLLAFLFLGESLRIRDGIGIALAICAVLTLTS
jgi:uncharacterized membrane protein